MKALLALVLFARIASAATWYASPSSTGGDGSIGNPWTLQLACSSGSIASNDTVNFRAGTYFTSGIRSSRSGVTYRSYPGEWAIVKAGLSGLLDTTMTTNVDGQGRSIIMIERSENWIPGQSAGIDNELISLDSTSGSPTNWLVNRGWGATVVTNHSAGANVFLYSASTIDHSGSYCTFREFEITTLMTTQRVGTVAFTAGPGLNLSGGVGNKAINLIVHDTGHPGIGFWDQGTSGEMNGCIIWGCGIYDVGGTWIRGGGVYAQNSIGSPLIKNNIFFRNLRAGFSAYGGAALINGFRIYQNIDFAPGDPSANAMQVMTDQNPMTNNFIGTNYVGAGASLNAVAVGYAATGSISNSMVGNIIVNGGLTSKENVSGFYTNNTVFMPFQSGDNGAIAFDTHVGTYKSNLLFSWDYNTYYFTNLTRPHQFNYLAKDVNATASDGSGNLIFTNDLGKSWQDWSGFDLHSSYNTSWPTNYLNVKCFPLDYNTNRAYIVVVSTSGQTSTTFDPATNSVPVGAIYTIRDAQNYFTVIASGTFTGSQITLPLNLTAIAPLQGSITNFVPQHTDVANPGLFNAFVFDWAPAPV